MNNQQKQARKRFKQLDREQSRYESYQLPRIIAALRKQQEPVLKYLADHSITETIHMVPNLIRREPIANMLLSLYISTGSKAATSERAFLKQFAGQKAFSFRKFWARIMTSFYEQYGVPRVTDITNTERERITKILIQANNDRLDNFQTAQKLKDENINQARALVITRTENLAAASKGASEGAKSTPFLLAKQWISALDKRTRTMPKNQFDHLMMNGTQIDEGDKFLVSGAAGGELLNYPGDPEGSAANVINCRCRAVYLPKRDLSGNLIMRQ